MKSVLKPLNPPENYGDVQLSVQASTYHYCSPREDLDGLDDYESVEVALIQKGNKDLLKPSEVGIGGFDHYFQEGPSPVAAYLSQTVVERLRTALRARQSAQEAR